MTRHPACRFFLPLFGILVLASAAGAATNVRVATVKPGTIRETLAFTGETRPLVETFITADVAGRIEKILAENGDQIANGQTVITLEPERYRITLDQAEANLRMAEQKVKEASKDFERTRLLFEKKAINERVYETAETASINAANQQKQARSAFDLAKLNLDRCSLKAPIAGFFVNRQGFIGQGVMPGTILGKVVELKRLFVEARIPEHQIGLIKIGQECSFADRVGKVAHIDLYADPARSFLVKILLDNDDLRFKANMFVKGSLVLNEFHEVPLVPLAALVTESEKTFAFVADGARARRLPVEVVAREGDLVYARGLEAGQTIIVVGQHSLKDGEEILLPEKAPPPASQTQPQ